MQQLLTSWITVVEKYIDYFPISYAYCTKLAKLIFLVCSVTTHIFEKVRKINDLMNILLFECLSQPHFSYSKLI